MRALRLNGRTLLLLFSEAALVYGAIVGAVYLRVGVENAYFELVIKHGYWKAAIATFFCIAQCAARQPALLRDNSLDQPEVTNLAETAGPLHELVDALRAPGRVTAQEMFGTGGWVVHNETNPFGFTGVHDWPTAFWFPEAAGWLARHLWEHYLFTGDAEFLRARAYPVLREAAEFWLANLHRDPRDGTLVVSPSYSPEHGPYTAGAAMSQLRGPIRRWADARIEAGDLQAVSLQPPQQDGDRRARIRHREADPGRMNGDRLGRDDPVEAGPYALDDPVAVRCCRLDLQHDGIRADAALQVGGRPLDGDSAVVDDREPVAEPIRLLHVVRGQ